MDNGLGTDAIWLERRLQAFGIELTEDRLRRLCRYMEQLLDWNERYALLSRNDTPHVFGKHVAASLGPLLVATPGQGQEWVDVGTGAGLPGLVLKVWEPTQEITLIEGSAKKCRFLEAAARSLGVGPIPILAKRVETLVAQGEMLGQFDLLLSRAVANVETTLLGFSPLLKSGGRLITYKGPAWRDELDAARRAGAVAPGRVELEEVVRVPWAMAHLLVFRVWGD